MANCLELASVLDPPACFRSIFPFGAPMSRASISVNALTNCGNAASPNSFRPPSESASKHFTSPRTMSFSGVQTDAMAVQCPAALDESTLVECIANGEPAAIADVYDLHHRAVHAFAWRLLGDPTAAEDLVHDVFVALPKAARRFRGEASLRTFLISIAVNHARHHVRSATRRRAAMDRLGREPESTGVTPEAQARQSELARALAAAMDELSVEHRVTFVLSEIEERNSREVSEILGIPDATVRTRLHHAKRKLRAVLERGGFR